MRTKISICLKTLQPYDNISAHGNMSLFNAGSVTAWLPKLTLDQRQYCSHHRCCLYFLFRVWLLPSMGCCQLPRTSKVLRAYDCRLAHALFSLLIDSQEVGVKTSVQDITERQDHIPICFPPSLFTRYYQTRLKGVLTL